MKEIAQILNQMKADGVISDYALFGAVAQIRYTEAVATLDVDVLVEVPEPNRVDVLSGIYEFTSRHGLPIEGEAIRVGPWPVQFVPAFDELTHEAVREAETDDFEGAPLRVVSAAHLSALALSSGRPKDFARILALLEANSVSRGDIKRLAERHRLSGQWEKFQARFLNEPR
jgi:predicted nucleotidyltransferase